MNGTVAATSAEVEVIWVVCGVHCDNAFEQGNATFGLCQYPASVQP
jgi:hypothetical protein